MTDNGYQEDLDVYSRCYDHSPLAFCIIDVLKDDLGNIFDFAFVYLNEALAKLEGKQVSDLLGKHFYQVFDNTDTKWLTFYGDVAYGGQANNFVSYSPEIGKYLNIQCYQIASGRCGCLLTDVTAQKEMESVIKMQRQYYLAVRSTKITVWEYDVEGRCFVLPREQESRQALLHYGFSEEALSGDIIADIPDCLMEIAYREKDRNTLRRIFQEIHQGKAYITGDIWYTVKPGGKTACDRITVSVVCNEAGKPVRAYGVSQDITTIKLEEAAYKNCMKLLLKVNSKVTLLFHVNLSQNTCGLGQGMGLQLIPAQPETYDDLLQYLGQLIILPKEAEAFHQKLSGEAISNEYYKGNQVLREWYHCKLGRNKLHWTKITVHSMHNPSTGDLEAIICVQDCHDEKTNEEIIHRFMKEEFEYTILLDLQNNNRPYIRTREGIGKLLPSHSKSDITWVLATDMEMFEPSGENRISQNTMLDAITRNLQHAESYSFIYSLRNRWGNESCKQIKYCYLDSTRHELLIMRMDVTKAVMKEREYIQALKQRSEKLLRIAMDVNERVLSAKLQLLYRMTRDLVTPMQSLQLLVEEGKKMTAKSDAMSKYLQSVERACNRLTTLSEDIVENLSLETGKLEIVYRKFNLMDMLKAVEDVVTPQAQSASLAFSVQLVQPLQAYYVGDIGRLRQILLRLLSNSLKCTPVGGHVTMEVEEETRDGNDSFLKFVIRDEGTGLSDAFMEQLFYSFRQKHLVSTAQMQEAGRGIFEAYNLVQLMGGTLDVGKYEKGNESIVRIPLKEPWTMMIS